MPQVSDVQKWNYFVRPNVRVMISKPFDWVIPEATRVGSVEVGRGGDGGGGGGRQCSFHGGGVVVSSVAVICLLLLPKRNYLF